MDRTARVQSSIPSIVRDLHTEATELKEETSIHCQEHFMNNPSTQQQRDPVPFSRLVAASCSALRTVVDRVCIMEHDVRLRLCILKGREKEDTEGEWLTRKCLGAASRNPAPHLISEITRPLIFFRMSEKQLHVGAREA
jgi:hypothetical protein